MFFKDVRALKGTAPKAAQFNKIASNLELIDSRTGTPRMFLARKSGNQSVTIGLTGAGQSITFNTETLDTASMFNAGTITIPSDTLFIRVMCNIAISAFTDMDVTLAAGVGTFLAHQQFGYSSSSDGVSHMHVDTGWVPYDGISTPAANINAFPGTAAFTISATEVTWFSVEVL